jgi:hypothetical protein
MSTVRVSDTKGMLLGDTHADFKPAMVRSSHIIECKYMSDNERTVPNTEILRQCKRVRWKVFRERFEAGSVTFGVAT